MTLLFAILRGIVAVIEALIAGDKTIARAMLPELKAKIATAEAIASAESLKKQP